MNIPLRSPRSTTDWLGGLRVAICLIFAPLVSTFAVSPQREKPSPPPIGLEIRLTNQSTPIQRLGDQSGAMPGTLIQRESLRINDPHAAREFTALWVQVEIEGDALHVSLFNVSNGEWDKREKIGESYVIRVGETVRISELEAIGIEPLEIKAVDARPVVLKPGEGPLITNTPSLEVEKLERHFGFYRLWLKNNSDKDIVVYEISTGRSAMQSVGGRHGANGTVLASGATSDELRVNASEIDESGIAISLVVFEDGTVEGDSKKATQYLAKTEGVRIQSPSVLRRIEETMQVADSDLRTSFVKLESELWLIPEALDKPSSIQFLRTKFPAEDEKSLSALYEVFKGGLYDGRNIALADLGETLRTVRRHEEQGHYASAVESIRKTLERLKTRFEKITSAPR